MVGRVGAASRSPASPEVRPTVITVEDGARNGQVPARVAVDSVTPTRGAAAVRPVEPARRGAPGGVGVPRVAGDTVTPRHRATNPIGVRGPLASPGARHDAAGATARVLPRQEGQVGHPT